MVVGVYIGFDKHQSLGKYETGSKAALPVFKDFIKNALYKDDFRPFNIPADIYFAPVNYDTGEQESFTNNKSIIEAFKLDDINRMSNNLEKGNIYDNLIKFRQFY